eukprot:CAMPEP_0197451316 /NCGR_PEP_ID=MMETSP1175-20131217/28423_1 /TAXON_ID=1003142 /ORGANISM="Triceratium dubium, Strain CCMP147" /LENGTH=44 /DNA_ID= /DNA_START= /DNA_END= /DNA_ORIENTATION=
MTSILASCLASFFPRDATAEGRMKAASSSDVDMAFNGIAAADSG